MTEKQEKRYKATIKKLMTENKKLREASFGPVSVAAKPVYTQLISTVATAQENLNSAYFDLVDSIGSGNVAGSQGIRQSVLKLQEYHKLEAELLDNWLEYIIILNDLAEDPSEWVTKNLPIKKSAVLNTLKKIKSIKF